MKLFLKLKDHLSYLDDRGNLSGQTVEPLDVMQGGFRIQVLFEGKKYWINKNDVERKIEKLDKGDSAFDGEFAAIIERLEAEENPSPELKEAVRVLRSLEKGMDYLLSKGFVSVRRLARIMDCYVEDLTGGL